MPVESGVDGKIRTHFSQNLTSMLLKYVYLPYPLHTFTLKIKHNMELVLSSIGKKNKYKEYLLKYIHNWKTKSALIYISTNIYAYLKIYLKK